MLREHPAQLIDSLEVTVAETVQPITDLWLDLEAV
jgi:hypothetical protein